uniref:G-protein coupled receptors family 1 profile domain-containing protein n=1 Tax=Plectus sambesii TaxID=2011161 RepID=A0A914UMD0_9BILA
MLIIAGLAGADLLNGIVAVMLTTYRVAIKALDQQNISMTAWDCVLLPPIFLNYLTSLMISVMNLLVSIDRYVAVVRPIQYRLLDIRHAYRLLGGAAIFALLSSVFLYASNYFGLERVYSFNRLCSGTLFPRFYMVYQFSLTALIGCISVVIYIVVYFVYRATAKRMLAQQTTTGVSKSTASQMDAQNRSEAMIRVDITVVTVYCIMIAH